LGFFVGIGWKNLCRGTSCHLEIEEVWIDTLLSIGVRQQLSQFRRRSATVTGTTRDPVETRSLRHNFVRLHRLPRCLSIRPTGYESLDVIHTHHNQLPLSIRHSTHNHKTALHQTQFPHNTTTQPLSNPTVIFSESRDSRLIYVQYVDCTAATASSWDCSA